MQSAFTLGKMAFISRYLFNIQISYSLGKSKIDPQNDMFEFGEINENIEVEVIFFGHLFCGAVSFSCLLVNRETNCSPLCKYSLFPTEHIPWK